MSRLPRSVLFFGRTGDEFGGKLAAFLEQRSEKFTAQWSEGFGAPGAPVEQSWSGDLIVCFRSRFILKPDLIRQARIAAINFHPGPPNYRGSGCVNFALYENAACYGSTAHLVSEQVDSGTILDVRRFPITSEDTLEAVLAKTYSVMLDQALDLTERLFEQGSETVKLMQLAAHGEDWSGPVRRMCELDALQVIHPQINREEFDRVYRATRIGSFGPILPLYGKIFKIAD